MQLQAETPCQDVLRVSEGCNDVLNGLTQPLPAYKITTQVRICSDTQNIRGKPLSFPANACSSWVHIVFKYRNLMSLAPVEGSNTSRNSKTSRSNCPTSCSRSGTPCGTLFLNLRLQHILHICVSYHTSNTSHTLLTMHISRSMLVNEESDETSSSVCKLPTSSSVRRLPTNSSVCKLSENGTVALTDGNIAGCAARRCRALITVVGLLMHKPFGLKHEGHALRLVHQQPDRPTTLNS